jgi:hypothetical protein
LLAATLYGDPALRPMSDLDLLVEPAQLAEVPALFASLGFRPTYPTPRARFSPRHGHDLSFTEDEPHLVVEVHYRLFHDLGGDASVEPLFARARLAEVLGVRRPVPSPADHLFAVAVHAATHAFGDHPVWIFDLLLLAAEEPGAVADATAEAARRGLSVAFATALGIAARVLPSLPAPRESPLRRRLLDQILGADCLAQPPGRLPTLLAKTLLTDRARDALYELGRKLELRLIELVERRQTSA